MNAATIQNAGNSHADSQMRSESSWSGQMSSGPNWSKNTWPGKATEQLETAYQETGARTGDGMGPGPMETE